MREYRQEKITEAWRNVSDRQYAEDEYLFCEFVRAAAEPPQSSRPPQMRTSHPSPHQSR